MIWTILLHVLCIILAYFIGCFSTGSFLAKRQNIDLRKQGSGSVGATNAFRAMGAKTAILTLVGDIAKGVIATGLGMLIAGKTGAYAGGIAVAVGHIWPVFSKFRGGKGVTTAMGAVLVLQPILALILVAIWTVMTAVLHMTSAASITAAMLYVAINIVMSLKDAGQMIFTIVLAGMLIYAHRENIMRLIKGRENKLDFHARHSQGGNGKKHGR